MKKSEAIKLIEDVLKSSYDYPAIRILQVLEEVGMKPPAKDKLILNQFNELVEDLSWEKE